MICPLTTNDLVQKMSPSYFKTQKSNTGLSSEVLHIVFVALLYFSEVINDSVVVQQSVDQSCCFHLLVLHQLPSALCV